MKKSARLLSIVLALLMVISMVPFAAFAETGTDVGDVVSVPDKWDGTADTTWYNTTGKTFTLSTAAQLAGLSALSANGNTFSGKTIVLGADMDLDGKQWTPIKQFSGTFDGGEHTVSNFTLDGTTGRAGFIQNLGQYPATVKNLTLSKVIGNAASSQYFGILVANGHTSILENVHVVDCEITTINKDAWVGGIYGYFNWTSASNCTVKNLVIDATKGAKFIGGFSGNMDQDLTIQNVDITGLKITLDATNGACQVGGFTGQTQTGHRQPTFNNCNVTGLEIVAKGEVQLGGFVGDAGAHTIANNCRVEGKIDASGVTDDRSFIGGFMADSGWNHNESSKGGHKLTNCSTKVDIITGGSTAGGFIGSTTAYHPTNRDDNRNMPITMENCSATGTVSIAEGATATIGGFAGEADRGTFKYCVAGQKEFIGCFLPEPITPVIIVDYVAQIGDTSYETIQGAISAAKTGDTVKLLSDIALTEADRVVGADRNVLIDVDGKDITLDMNGKKISVVHEDVFADDYIVAVVRVADGAGLTVTGNGTIDIKVLNENPDLAYMFWKRGTTGHLTIENGTYHMNDSADSMIYTNGDEIVTVKGGTFTLDAYGTRSNEQPWIFNASGQNTANIIVTGGTFNADIIHQFYPFEVMAPKEKALVKGEDGMWSFTDAVAYVNEQEWSSTWYTNEVGYATLEKAIAAVEDIRTKSGKTSDEEFVTVIGTLDITESVANENGRKIVGNIVLKARSATLKAPEDAGLNVTSGVRGYEVKYAEGVYKLIVDEENPVVTIGSVADLLDFSAAVTGNTKYQDVKVAANPKVVVTLTADLDLAGSGFAPIGNGGANAFSGTFDGQGHTISNMTLSCNYYRGVGFFRSLGDGAVVKNVTFVNANVNNGAASSANHFYGVVAGFSNNLTLDNVDIKNSTVTCKYAGAGMVGCLEGATTIKNCDIENVTLTTTNIRGSVFGILGNSANGHSATLENNTVKDFVFIVDGEIKAAKETLNYNEWAADTEYTEDCYVAQIGETKYTTLYDAIAAAQDGDTVTLIGDVELAKFLTINKTITLDLGKYDITRNGGTALYVNGDVEVTVKGTTGTVIGSQALYVNSGLVKVEGGNFQGTYEAVYVINTGKVEIYGGTFSAKEVSGFVLNEYDKTRANTVITVYGGTFKGFNPADNAAEGTGTNFVAKGYTSEEIESGVYGVRKLNYVAEVNGVKYESLQTAIDYAQDGDTIKLIQNILLDDINDVEARDAASNGNGKYCGFDYGNGAFFNVIDKDVTVDLNGYTITYDIHDEAWCNKRVVSLFYATDKSNLTITDSSEKKTGAVTVYGMATAVYSVAVDTNVTINGGTWTWNKCKTCGATNAFLYASHGGELYIKGGKFVNNVDGDAGEYMIFSHYSSKETTENSAGVDYDQTKIAISGGTFVNCNPGEIKYMDQGNGNKETVDDGCAEGYAPVNNGNGTYGVALAVAAIGDKNYASIQDAVAAAKTGDTVKLLKDVTLTEADCVAGADRKVLIDVVGKDITLDMNDKKISVVHEDAFTNDYIVAVVRVADGAGLTVTGNGTIDVKVLEENPDLAYMFWKRGTTGHLTIENGTYHMNDSADSMVYTNGNEIVTIKGGTWTLDTYGTRGNREPWIFNVAGAGDNHVIVTGGTFNADINRQFWSNEVYIGETFCTVDNGDGTWTVKEGAVAHVNTGMLTGPYYYRKEIGYGTFAEAVEAAKKYDDPNITLLANVVIDVKDQLDWTTINGQNLNIIANGFEFELCLTEITASVKGSEDLNVTSGVAGYEVIYENGEHKLSRIFVAQNTRTGDKYTTVAEALAEAQSGDTVILLRDCSENYVLVTPGVTLNLKGKTLSAEYVVGFNGSNVRNGNRGTGGIVVKKDNMVLDKNNEHLPIYDDANGCYVFAKIDFVAKDIDGNQIDRVAVSGKQFIASPIFTFRTHDIIATGAKKTGMNVVIRVSWTDVGGTYTATQDYVYSDDIVASVVTSWNADLIKHPNDYAKAFDAKFGATSIEATSVTVSIVMISDTGVEIESKALPMNLIASAE